jgi:type IV pilus assembly protein PilM
MALFNPLAKAFGLDIGDRTFKLVQVERRGRDPKRPYRITAWNTVDVPEGVMEKGDVKDMDAAAKAVVQLVKTAHGKLAGRAAVACLPEAKTFIKIIEVPKGSGREEMERAVRKEIELNIPLPQEEIYYDWQSIDQSAASVPEKTVIEKPSGGNGPSPRAKKSGDDAAAKTSAAAQEVSGAGSEKSPPTAPSPQRVLMGASPKKLADDYTTLLEKAGLTPVALEIEAMAISRAIVPTDAFMDEAVGLLDIGATRSSLVIYDSGALQMSISIPISGLAITQIISESLGISLSDAELLKQECGLDSDRCEDKMWNILLPLIDDITEKIRNALRFYKIGFPSGKKIERLFLCGGGAQFREIDTVLSRKLTIRTQRGDVLSSVDRKIPKTFPKKEDALKYATAIGLAMRAADENARHQDSFL